MKVLAPIFCAVALAAQPAVALDPAACVGPSHPRNTVFGHADLGHGKVLEERSFSDRGMFQIEFGITDCATGETVVPLVWSEGFGDKEWNLRIEALALARTSATQSVSDIGTEMNAIGVPIDQFTIPEETCACAAFHPELRGSKPPYTEPVR